MKIYSIILPWDDLQITKVALHKYFTWTEGEIYEPTPFPISYVAGDSDDMQWFFKPDEYYLYLSFEIVTIILTRLPYKYQQVSFISGTTQEFIQLIENFLSYLRAEGYLAQLPKYATIRTKDKKVETFYLWGEDAPS